MYISWKHIVVFIVGLLVGKCLFKFPKEMIEENLKDKTNLITKKDYFYWLTFLILFIVLWTSIDLSAMDDFSTYISFAGTVTSIILGVVAIIYSYFQGYDSARNLDSLEKTSQKIDSVSNDLITSVTEIKDLSERLKEINGLIDGLSCKVESLNSEMADLKVNVDTNFKKTNSILKESKFQNVEEQEWEKLPNKSNRQISDKKIKESKASKIKEED